MSDPLLARLDVLCQQALVMDFGFEEFQSWKRDWRTLLADVAIQYAWVPNLAEATKAIRERFGVEEKA